MTNRLCSCYEYSILQGDPDESNDSDVEVLFSFFLSVFPFNCRVNYVCGRFSTPFLSHFYRSSRILQQPQSVFEVAHFCRFLTSSLLSCVGALSSIIIADDSSPTGAYSFSKSEMEFYVCAAYFVHRHGTSYFKYHPRRLGNVQ